jgi:hypothetical protein
MRKFFAAVLLCALTSPAMAATVTYQFSGTVVNTWGKFGGQGSTITGLISFDEGLVDTAPSNLVDNFVSRTFAATVFVAAVQDGVSNGSLLLDNLNGENRVLFSLGTESRGSTTVDMILDASFAQPLNLTSMLEGDLPILDGIDLAQATRHDGAFRVRDSSTGNFIDVVTFEWIGLSRVVPINNVPANNWRPLAAALVLLLGGLVVFVVVRVRARRGRVA